MTIAPGSRQRLIEKKMERNRFGHLGKSKKLICMKWKWTDHWIMSIIYIINWSVLLESWIHGQQFRCATLEGHTHLRLPPHSLSVAPLSSSSSAMRVNLAIRIWAWTPLIIIMRITYLNPNSSCERGKVIPLNYK